MPNDASPDRLLIVEDDAAQRTGLQKLLTSWGFTVDVAKDGREALDMFAQSRPSIVLSDMGICCAR
jgi:CheY-like chemotaxis protein